MTTIARWASGSALIVAALMGAFTARQFGSVPGDGAASSLEALLLLAGVCFGGSAAILLLLYGSARNK